jgi:hypothetical protein
MNSNNRIENRAARARGFVALCAVLALGLGLLASPAAAAPFAYVATNPVSVIDTATKRWWPRSRLGVIPLRSPSPRMGNTSMSRNLAAGPPVPGAVSR